MKKLAGILAVAALVVTSATTVFAGIPARTGVNGSVHDMNIYEVPKGATPDKNGRVCVFCHTPHNASTDIDSYPLWNHNFTGVAAWQSYQWATQANFDGSPIADPLTGPSRLCMSCHDGATAIDQHGSNGSQVGTGGPLSGARAVGDGGNLTNDHPIGFDYTAAVAARNSGGVEEIMPIDTPFATAITVSLDQGVYNAITRDGAKKIKDVLYLGRVMTCASCHEVHNKENAIQDQDSEGVTPNYLLYAKVADSLICLSCHKK